MAVTRSEAIAFSDDWARPVAKILREAYNQAQYIIPLWATDPGVGAIINYRSQFQEYAKRFWDAWYFCDKAWDQYVLQRSFRQESGNGAATIANDPDVDVSADNPDLSDVNIGDTLWLAEGVFTVQGSNNVSKIITVNGTLPQQTASGLQWAVSTEQISYSQFFAAQGPDEIIEDGTPRAGVPGPITVQNMQRVMDIGREAENWGRANQFTPIVDRNPTSGDDLGKNNYLFRNDHSLVLPSDPSITTVPEAQRLVDRATELVADYDANTQEKLVALDRLAVAPRGSSPS